MRKTLAVLALLLLFTASAMEITVELDNPDELNALLKEGGEVITRVKVKGVGGGTSPTTWLPEVSGTAPYLFWDEVDSTNAADVVSWNFGDTGSTHNTLNGWNGAHVYETAGTFTVTRIHNGITTYRHVVVSAFAGTTYYVSSSGDDDNDGLTTGAPFATVDKCLAVLTAAVSSNPAVNIRFLFKRGDSFDVGSTGFALPRATNPTQLYFGAYGTGDKPAFTSASARFVSSSWYPSNIYCVDLDLTGGSGLSRFLGGNNHLVLRCDISGVGNPSLEVSENTARTNVWWIDTTTYNSTNPCYIGSNQLVVLGCTMQIAQDEHILRVWIAQKGIISHNTLEDPSTVLQPPSYVAKGYHSLKLHSSEYATWGHTQKVWLEGNTFRGSAWPVNIGPVDVYNAEELEHIVFTGNTINPDPMTYEGSKVTSQSLTIFADYITTFGNTYVDSGAGSWEAVVQRSGVSGMDDPVGVDVQDATLVVR